MNGLYWPIGVIVGVAVLVASVVALRTQYRRETNPDHGAYVLGSCATAVGSLLAVLLWPGVLAIAAVYYLVTRKGSA